MNKYKVKDLVNCQVETRINGTKAIVSKHLPPEELSKLEIKQFEIIAVQNIYPDSTYHMYTIVIDDDMVGWMISEFHIRHQKVDIKFKNKRFWELTEEFIQPISTDSK
jgi:hypothetical protein